MDKQQTHAEVMQEIEALKEFADRAIAEDCWGDYMSYMDRVKYSYFMEEGEGIEVDYRNGLMLRGRFKAAILREINGLWGVARSTYEKELYAMERY